jgi:predicted ATP-grasp superfamily ATP-dependent carboligase
VRDERRAPPRSWLLKRRASGGGRGVSEWTPERGVPRGTVLQERVDGVVGSVAFVADGRAAVPIAFSRQLVGDAAFGARGFAYCGSILGAAGDAQFERDAELYATATDLAAAAATAFGLVGACGIDFVARDGTPYPIEVNPRYSASMELAERAYGVSVFAAHACACGGQDGPGAASALPAFELRSARRRARAVGKAVVYARRDVTLGDTRPWLDDDSVRDVPHPGERIPAGRPVCTVFADGCDAAACYHALVRRARRLYDEIEGDRR